MGVCSRHKDGGGNRRGRREKDGKQGGAKVATSVEPPVAPFSSTPSITTFNHSATLLPIKLRSGMFTTNHLLENSFMFNFGFFNKLLPSDGKSQ